MKREALMSYAVMPEKAYQALMSAARQVEEETVVKRKLSVGLVFVLASLLIAGAALAIGLTLRETGRKVVETEQTEGYYAQWAITDKADLVRALVELDYVEETEDIRRLLDKALSEQDAHLTADAVLTAFTGREISEVSFMILMEAAWGPFEQWDFDEQAWYSRLMVDMNIQQWDHTLYMEPEGPVDEAQAIAIAKRAIAKGYGIEVSALDSYSITTSFQVPEFSAPGDRQAYWYVELTAPESMLKDERPFGMIWVFIHPETGTLLNPVEDLIAVFQAAMALENDPLLIALGTFELEHGYIHSMSLESRALWSETFRPLIAARQQDDPDFFSEGFGNATFLSSAAFIYGVPDGRSISQEDALALAEDALVTMLGRDPAEIMFYTRYKEIYYDITDADKPLWKFFFPMPNAYVSDRVFGAQVLDYYGSDGERLLNYKVELNAITGEIDRAFGIEPGGERTLADWMLYK
jgi:hypothetical protein